ncbi:nuclear transport factor 2 family protein [Streptomyces sp. NPDC050658]|uniref:nuclear transport factor 2 family protein n=1 Tax=unclassified Streptomyces TaxID=2593676 RepID=UPI00341C26F7
MTTHTDHLDIALLVSRFFRALDERKFDEGWGRAYFTDDVRTDTPVGTSEGADVVAHTEVAIGRFAGTQHISSDLLVDTEDGTDHATASWNALMTHVHHDSTLRARGETAHPLFTVGGRFDTELRRTPDGWRISRMAVDVIWTTGEPPVLPEGTLRTPASAD